MASYWIRECDIDGWRLDVADEIHHAFWKRFRREIKAVKKDALIIGEIWHFAGDFLEGDEWDSIMNYQFYHAVIDLVASDRMRASSFVGKLNFGSGLQARYALGSGQTGQGAVWLLSDIDPNPA